MNQFDGLDVSRKMTAICGVDKTGRRKLRRQCPSIPEQIGGLVGRMPGTTPAS